jgi:hypothetical protein
MNVCLGEEGKPMKNRPRSRVTAMERPTLPLADFTWLFVMLVVFFTMASRL